MSRPSNLRSAGLHYAQGLLMGGADIIPGVSGGTMALIVGIYERLIASVRAVANAALQLVRGRPAESRERLTNVEWRLVLPLAAGILTALILGARFIPGILEAYPVQSRAVFFGLIVGSLVIPWRRIGARKTGHLFAAVAGAALAFMLSGLPPRELAQPSLLAVFLAAAVAICAMILPGVSGSFLLFVMGMYAPTLEAVNERNLLYIAVFGLGAVIGLGTFSKLLDYLLRSHHDSTMAVLVGLMAGSLRALWPWQSETRELFGPPSSTEALGAFALMLLALALVTGLARWGGVDRRPQTPRKPRQVVDTR